MTHRVLVTGAAGTIGEAVVDELVRRGFEVDAWDLVELRAPGSHRHRRRPAPAGRSGTKLHLAVEQGQKPMSIVVTAGQRGDSPQFETVLAQVRVPRLGSGRPRVRPDRVRADKAYASRKNRAAADGLLATAAATSPATTGVGAFHAWGMRPCRCCSWPAQGSPSTRRSASCSQWWSPRPATTRAIAAPCSARRFAQSSSLPRSASLRKLASHCPTGLSSAVAVTGAASLPVSA